MHNKVREPLFHIVKRDTLPWYQAWGIRAVAIVLALLLCALITTLCTHLNPIKVFGTMFSGAFGSPRKIWILGQNLAILLCISLAVTPAFKMRFWNIGAEGQVLAGGLAAAACMICLGDKLPNGLLIVLIVIAGILAGAVWAVIPAIFKAKWNTNETLFTRMMNYVRRGDTVIIESISRFARNTRDLLDLVKQLTEKQVEFVSRKEAIDTTTPTGKFMLTVFAAVAELEREYILQRQREGIAIAKEQGKYTGRKPMPLPDNFERVVARWRAGEITAAEAMRQTGLKANTFYRRCSQTSLALKRIQSI